MRLNTSTPILFAASSLFCFGSSLPFFRAEVAWLEPLLRRATYSVVAVDGGSTIANPTPSTIIETVTQTPPPATTTVIETAKVTLQASTTTQVISGPETTKTLIITIVPPASIVTTTAYSVVNVSPSVGPSSLSTTASSSTSSTIAISSDISSIPSLVTEGTSLSSATYSQSSTATSSSVTSTDGSEYTSYTSSSLSTLITSTITSSVSSTPTASYDDGKWHTTYPHWTNGTASMTTPSIPARTASPITTGAERGSAATTSSLVARALVFGSNLLQALGVRWT